MNFFEGELTVEENNTFFAANGEKLYLKKVFAPAYSGKCTLGVRPEAIKILTTEERKSERERDFNVPILLKEGHGHETHIICQLFRKKAIVRTANPNRRSHISESPLGSTLPVTIDRLALHWFDQNGCRIE